MKEVIFEIIENSRLSDGIYLMRLAGDTSAVTAPGQFVNLKLAGRYLRRPISVHDWEDGELKLIYKVLGHGTEQMTTMEKGEKLNILVGLGNGFDGAKSGDKPLLVGGGVGIPPLYGLARRLRAEGKEVTAVLGFNKEADIFAVERFESIGVKTIVATADGSRGVRGFVTDGMAEVDEYSYLYTCGPEAMLRAVYGACKTSGQFSFEERMGCGFGACMGCSCKTKYGTKRICKDGPVLEKEEIIW